MERIKHVYSLGTNCYSRWLLERSELTRASGPFDWLFSDLRIVKHCIEDDFKVFLDRSQYFHVDGGTTTQYGHHFYSPMSSNKGPTLFNHHDVSLDHNYAHFQRAVDRFIEVLNSNEPTLFATFAPPAKLDADLFRGVVEAISARRANFKVLGVIMNAPKSDRQPERPTLVETIGDSELYNLRVTSGHKGGLSFENDADNDLVASTYANLVFDLPAGTMAT